MAIDNVEAVKFSNEKVRRLADMAGAYYLESKRMAAYWGAKNLGALIVNSESEFVVDGSEVDGRTPISRADIRRMLSEAQDFITAMEATGNTRLNAVLKVAVNP